MVSPGLAQHASTGRALVSCCMNADRYSTQGNTTVWRFTSPHRKHVEIDGYICGSAHARYLLQNCYNTSSTLPMPTVRTRLPSRLHVPAICQKLRKPWDQNVGSHLLLL